MPPRLHRTARVLRSRVEEGPPAMEGTCEYIEQAAADRRQGAILQLEGCAWPHHIDTQLFWKEVISIQNQISAQSKLRLDWRNPRETYQIRQHPGSHSTSKKIHGASL
jgi:hypothetical protein